MELYDAADFVGIDAREMSQDDRRWFCADRSCGQHFSELDAVVCWAESRFEGLLYGCLDHFPGITRGEFTPGPNDEFLIPPHIVQHFFVERDDLNGLDNA